MFLWVLRLLYTSKEDFQAPQQDKDKTSLGGSSVELAPLPSVLAPVYEPLPPVLPPRMRGLGGKEDGHLHSRTVSDVSFMSTSSYGSQTTG